MVHYYFGNLHMFIKTECIFVQAALHVWKTIVANTPKTLREIMPVLMDTLITSLASSSSERRQVCTYICVNLFSVTTCGQCFTIADCHAGCWTIIG